MQVAAKKGKSDGIRVAVIKIAVIGSFWEIEGAKDYLKVIEHVTNVFGEQGNYNFRAVGTDLISPCSSFLFLSYWEHDEPMAPKNVYELIENDPEIERKLMAKHEMITRIDFVPNKKTAINMEGRKY